MRKRTYQILIIAIMLPAIITCMLGSYGYMQNGFVIAGITMSAVLLAIAVYYVYLMKHDELKTTVNLAVGFAFGIAFGIVAFS